MLHRISAPTEPGHPASRERDYGLCPMVETGGIGYDSHMNLLVLVIILFLLFGGGGFYIGGPAVGGGGLGLVLLICLIIYFMGGFRAKP